MKKRIYRLLFILVFLQFLMLGVWTHWLYFYEEGDYGYDEYQDVEDSDREVMHV